MKRFFHKILSISMAFVLLLSTMSITVDMHYCGNTMIDFSFFHNVDTCGMDKAEIASSCQNPEMSKKSCCSDEQLVIEGQDDLKDTFSNLIFEQQIFVTTFISSYTDLFEETTSKAVPFIDYSPPFVKRDVQVLHQIFLI